MALFGAMVTATFALMCVFALVKARRAQREASRIRGLMMEAKDTKIRDAPGAGRVLLTGTAKAKDGRAATAPFTGEDVLWARASAQTNVGSVIDSWTVQVDELTLDDNSGVVANVRLAGADVRVEETSVSGQQSLVTAYFNSIARSPGSSEFYWQMALRPGDVVSVLGTVASGGRGYRDHPALELSSAAGELIVFDPAREDVEPTRRADYARMAILGIAVFGLATVTLLIFAFT